MKRRLFKLILFLLLGVIVNVAVAWGLAWKLDVTRGHTTVKNLIEAEVGKETPYHLWGVYRLKRPGAMRVFSYHMTASTGSSDGRDPGSLLPSWNQDYFLEIQRDEWNKFARMQDGRGWPMLALWGQAVADSMSSQPFCEVEYAILLTYYIDPSLYFFGPSPFLSVYREVSISLAGPVSSTTPHLAWLCDQHCILRGPTLDSNTWSGYGAPDHPPQARSLHQLRLRPARRGA